MNEFRANFGFDLGATAANRSMDQGQTIMAQEKRRIELTNEAPITECKAQGKIFLDERDSLRAFLRNVLPGVHDARSRRLYCIVVALILMIGGLSFTHIALLPFDLGWQSWLWAVAVALVCASLADVALQHFGHPRVVGVLAALGFVAGVLGLIVLSRVRADVLATYLKIALSSGDAATLATSDAAEFYSASVHRLQLLFSLLAVALEIATGLLVWEAGRISVAPLSAVEQAKKRLAEIEPKMAQLAGRIVFLQNEPEIFAATFMRDFHRGLTHGTERRSPTRIGRFAFALFLGTVLAQLVCGQTATVILPDMTRSTVVARAFNGPSEYEKDLDATAKLLSELPAGSKFAVMAISESSFSSPRVLVSGRIPGDPGPLQFLNRINLSRTNYVAQFKTATAAVNVSAQKTDIIGGFFVASDFLRGSTGQRNIIALSDMRQSAKPLDIETPKVVPVKTALETLEREHLIPDLRGVNIWLLGVDASGKDIAYISSLRAFWTAFCVKSGANLRAFSSMREVTDLNLSSIGERK
ncbi:MAG TPA: hypothetical protein VGN17_03855 [Bryobacteraceae bacterium]|jgi:hypothetical protein